MIKINFNKLLINVSKIVIGIGILGSTLILPTNVMATDLEQLRVGIYYNDPKFNLYKSVDSLKASSQEGIKIGILIGGNFQDVVNNDNSNYITVRQDSYYNIEGWKYTKKSESEISDATHGPYHIRIGEKYSSYAYAKRFSEKYIGEGVNTYLYYDGKWQVMYGAFKTDSTADSYASRTLTSTLNIVDYTVVKGTDKSMIIEDSKGNIIYIHDDENSKLRFKSNSQENGIIKILNKDKNYRGEFEIYRHPQSDLTLVNIVSMREYLFGVVPYEIGASSPMESLKAQAVAARNYAVITKGKHNHVGFELCDTVNCQVYGGYDGESINSNNAIINTDGELLKYEGKPASIFYFSSSGGQTEDVKNVWGSEIPYLKSVSDNYESGGTYHYNWDVTFTANRIKEIMDGRGYYLGNILSLDVTKRSEAGRATELVITGSDSSRTYERSGTRNVFSLDSQWYDITTDADINILKSGGVKEERLANKKVLSASGVSSINGNLNTISILGNNSTKKASVIPNEYRFIGKGWGHSVGMSQDGAIGMARAGFNYKDILTHYFQGTYIE